MHTPGVWRAELLNDPQWAVTFTEMGFICVTSQGNDQANACLIAAAPDLLAACEAMLDMIRWAREPWDTEQAEQARAAIAKARGEAGGNESERQCQLNTKWQGCCCQCQYHLRDVVHSYAAGHPVTSDEKEQRGWACAVAFMLYHEREVYSGWPEHGFCELNDPGVEEQDDEPGT